MATNRPARVDDVRQAMDFSRGAIELLWGTFELHEAENLSEALNRLSAEFFDLVLLDPDLEASPRSDPLNAILLASPRTAIVVVVGDEDDGSALNVLRQGAQDYILEGELKSRTLVRALRGAVERKASEMRVAESRAELIWRLAKAAEYRDAETGNHVIRVSCYARELGIALGLSRNDVETLFLASPLHDIGKIGIPDSVLRKPGRLTDEEMGVMRQHCAIGARILDQGSEAEHSAYTQRVITSGCLGKQDDPVRNMAREIALSHHERWDGAGYPNQLAGEHIPLPARIVAICDVFDALLSPRPYKSAFPLDETLAIIRDGAGKHFDPAISAAFETILPSILDILEGLSESTSEDANSESADLFLGAYV